MSSAENFGHMEDSRWLRGWDETVEGGRGVCGSGGREGGRDGLINRVSDSTPLCPWDESRSAHRRSAASGNCV